MKHNWLELARTSEAMFERFRQLVQRNAGNTSFLHPLKLVFPTYHSLGDAGAVFRQAGMRILNK